MKTILVLDDDAEAAELVAQGLAAPGREVRTFGDPLRALAAIHAEPVDLLIADLRMPFVDGMEVMRQARATRPGLQMIIVSGMDGGEAIAREGGARFLAKPVDLDVLRVAVSRALDA